MDETCWTKNNCKNSLRSLSHPHTTQLQDSRTPVTDWGEGVTGDVGGGWIRIRIPSVAVPFTAFTLCLSVGRPSDCMSGAFSPFFLRRFTFYFHLLCFMFFYCFYCQLRSDPFSIVLLRQLWDLYMSGEGETKNNIIANGKVFKVIPKFFFFLLFL